ncbi:MAG: bifunctional riboflavin kinase/FAD synthetase [Alphaproteobacteria bacterium]|nr:bifunctional riboflavin kinase/FAD synthetase [Alphaproteobacteria bacterium]
MRVIPYHSAIPPDLRGASAALGNFDGLHAGHREVIAQARKTAAFLNAPLIVATFEPSPRLHFQPNAVPFRLMTARRRAIELAGLGVDACCLLRFDAEMASMTDREFAQHVLRDQLGLRAVAVGFDFRFGKGRTGAAETLRRLGEELGFETSIVEEVAEDGRKVSSTGIRQMIQNGDMRGAGAALGGYWIVDAVVEHGEKRGRSLGFPTANLSLGDIVSPAHGVYAVWARLDEESAWRPGVASFGRTPTTGLRDPLLEVVIFDFAGDLYGRRLHVAFAAHLRPEIKFEGIEALVEQMRDDAAEARAALGVLSPPLSDHPE